MPSKIVYKNQKAGQPLISTISSGCVTPLLKIKFSNLVKPFYYPNSPTTPRYSITCVIEPVNDKDFLKSIQTIEKNEKVETIIKNETEKKDKQTVYTGRALIKFQSKEVIPVFIRSDQEKIDLEDEIAQDEKVIIFYDILRYTKKNTASTEHGISFKPTRVYYFPQEENEEVE